MPQRKIIIALKAKDEQVVRRALQGLGKDGEVALRRIDTASVRTQRSMRRVRSSVGGLRSAITAIGPAWLTAGGAAAGFAVAISSAMRRARRAITELDVLDDVASKLGLGVEALQELRFAAEQTGVSMQTFDMAMQRFTRRTAEAANGTGEAKDALAEMGIALRDSQGNLRSNEALLRDVADAFSNIEDPAVRLRLAFKLFDSEGAALVNTLSQGSAALDDFSQTARDMGAVVDESMVKQASAAADQLSALERVINTQLNQAVVDLADPLVAMAEGFANVARNVSDLIDRFRDLDERSTRGLKTRLSEINELLESDSIIDRLRLSGGYREKILNERLLIEQRFEAQAFQEAARGTSVTDTSPPLINGLQSGAFDPSPVARPAGSRPASARSTSRSTAASARPRIAAPDPFAFMQPPSETAAEALEDFLEAQDRLRDKALQTLGDLRQAHLEANGEIEQIVNSRRDKELASLEELKLTEEEAAEARVLINEKAAAEIGNHHAEVARRQAEENERLTQRTVSAFANMAQTVGASFGRMARDGEASIGQITELLINLATQFALLQASGGGFNFGGLFGAASAGATAIGGVATVHTGGVMGVDATRRRNVSMASFMGAPRLHGGFMPNEFPAVLERGEGVFTPGQMRALGEGPKVEVVVNNNANVKVDTSESREGDRFKLMIEIDDITGRLARGEGSALNKAIRDVSGSRPRGVNR